MRKVLVCGSEKCQNCRTSYFYLRESTYIYCKNHKIGNKIRVQQSWPSKNSWTRSTQQISDPANTFRIEFWVYWAVRKIVYVEFLGEFMMAKIGHRRNWGWIFEIHFLIILIRSWHRIHLGDPDRSRTQVLTIQPQIFSCKRYLRSNVLFWW